MHILIRGLSGNDYVVKKASITRVIKSTSSGEVRSIVSISGRHNNPLIVAGTPGEFFAKYLEKK